MVRTPCFHCPGPRSVPGQGTKILQAGVEQPKKRKEKPIKFQTKTIKSITIFTSSPLSPMSPILDFNLLLIVL